MPVFNIEFPVLAEAGRVFKKKKKKKSKEAISANEWSGKESKEFVCMHWVCVCGGGSVN